MQTVKENADDDEDNIPMSSNIEVLRKGNENDDDNVPLSLKYQTTPQSLIPNDTDVEIVGANPAEMEVEVEDDSLVLIGDDGEPYGIDGVDALNDIVVENTVDNMLEDIFNKVDMELAEELVRELEDKEATEKANTAKTKTYKTIEEQSSVMKSLLKHLEFQGSQDKKIKADMYLRLRALVDNMENPTDLCTFTFKRKGGKLKLINDKTKELWIEKQKQVWVEQRKSDIQKEGTRPEKQEFYDFSVKRGQTYADTVRGRTEMKIPVVHGDSIGNGWLYRSVVATFERERSPDYYYESFVKEEGNNVTI
ncbi:hypothetical protein Dimus_033561 [Dionaea muscipula]